MARRVLCVVVLPLLPYGGFAEVIRLGMLLRAYWAGSICVQFLSADIALSVCA